MEKQGLAASTYRSRFDHSSYPLNLNLSGPRYSQARLQNYKRLLDDYKTSLCCEDAEDIELPIRDLYDSHGQESPSELSLLPSYHSSSSLPGVKKCNIHTHKKLLSWLEASDDIFAIGDTPSFHTSYSNGAPQCRFIYLYAENSRDHLRVTYEMLTLILTYHRVMPDYVDFMINFGSQADAKGMNFSKFCSLTTLKFSVLDKPDCLTPSPSGQHLQLCYNIKGVTLKHSRPESIKLNEWSVRQAAIYHSFDAVRGTTLWLVTKGRRDLCERFKCLTGQDGRLEDRSFSNVSECFRSSMATHMMFCHWSEEDWESYIAWLEEILEKETIMTIFTPRVFSPGYQQYEPHHIQELQVWKDKANEATAHLQSNIDVITALRNYYVQLMDNKHFPTDLRMSCEDDVEFFVTVVDEITTIFKLQINRLNLLDVKVRERKDLMLQHLQGQAVERTERLNMNLERDQIRMSSITTVTLIFLPATFVSTLFSTDIARYQETLNNDQDSYESFSRLALIRWLEVTIPLTVTTIALAWWYSKRAEYSRKLRREGVRDDSADVNYIWNGWKLVPWRPGRTEPTSPLPVHECKPLEV